MYLRAMQELLIQTGTRESRIVLGDTLANLSNYLPVGKKVVVITDENLNKYYGHFFNQFPVVVLPTGEKNKVLSTIDYIFSEFIRIEVDRSWFVLGVGGGIVSDVTGFAASIYMRGLNFGFVSTSLLSQVDASVGGKNGVNFQGYKNMVGVFAQPDFVLCDISLFKTLPPLEYISGFAEIIKAAAIKDRGLFAYLEDNVTLALDMDPSVLEHLVTRSVAIKAEVVTMDEREKGERKKLNFGHTFAHAIEKITQISHGEAVAIGMVLATNASVKMGLLDSKEAERITTLISAYTLPVILPMACSGLLEYMRKDKKREGDVLHLVLLNQIGNAVIHPVSLEKLEKIVYDLC
jgi:3-dehydroquinate synthase